MQHVGLALWGEGADNSGRDAGSGEGETPAGHWKVVLKVEGMAGSGRGVARRAKGVQRRGGATATLLLSPSNAAAAAAAARLRARARVCARARARILSLLTVSDQPTYDQVTSRTGP